MRLRFVFLVLFFLTGISQNAEAQKKGKPAPDFTGTTLDGKTVKLSDLKGHVVILDFWASWCGPCLKEMPYLVELYNNYRRLSKVPLTILAINVDTDEEAMHDFLDRLDHKVPFPILVDPEGDIPSLYKVAGMPTTLMIDTDGVVAFSHSGFRDSDRKTYQEMLSSLVEEEHGS